jgi:hypothetical protein
VGPMTRHHLKNSTSRHRDISSASTRRARLSAAHAVRGRWIRAAAGCPVCLGSRSGSARRMALVTFVLTPQARGARARGRRLVRAAPSGKKVFEGFQVKRRWGHVHSYSELLGFEAHTAFWCQRLDAPDSRSASNHMHRVAGGHCFTRSPLCPRQCMSPGRSCRMCTVQYAEHWQVAALMLWGRSFGIVTVICLHHACWSFWARPCVHLIGGFFLLCMLICCFCARSVGSHACWLRAQTCVHAAAAAPPV